jgi:tRNA1(Val) A37 N6-methylase TrmN6
MLELLEPPGAAREDRLLGGRVRLRQPIGGYRAAIDPVLLAAAVAPGPGDLVVDLGCGAGAAFLCLGVRVGGCRLAGLEIDPIAAALARENIRVNGLADRAAVTVGDVRRVPLAPGSADRVMVNPPYLPADAARASPVPGRDAANREAGAAFTDWLAAARTLLKPRGWLILIHRADRLDAVVAGLAHGFGAVTVLPVWPKPGQAASRIVIRARKDARSPASLLPGLVLHRPGGTFTEGAEAILRDAAPLPFDD